MYDLKACVVCFKTKGKLHKIESGQLRDDFYSLSGFKMNDMMGIPQYLCVECAAHVVRFSKFRERCKRAHYTLKELFKSTAEITTVTLEMINTQQIGISSPLSFLNLRKAHYEEAKFRWVKDMRHSISPLEVIPVFHCGTIAFEDFEVPVIANPEVTLDVKQESDVMDIDYSDEYKENQTASNIDITDNSNFFDDDHDGVASDGTDFETETCKDEKDVDGTNLDEEYASMIPISLKEAQAAVEVYKMFGSSGKYKCAICSKSFQSDKRYKVHLRMHDKHTSGNFLCNLCHYYYKTEFLLKTHMTEKHMYKYLCRKCPEVNFDRMSAKQHYIWSHLQKGTKKHANWYDSRPTWLSNRGGKRVKGVATLQPVRKICKLPDDFLVYSPVSQEEQYALVLDRRKTRNYTDAVFKCEMCYRGFRELETYSKHMRKHDPSFAGKVQCDMCKLYFLNTRKLYKHMNITHLFKYSCQMCSYVCYNRGQAQMHYRWHKDVTYQCPHCLKEFKKASTRLTHIRIKHPSMYICALCGHSFVSENGLYQHKNLSHTREEVESSESRELDVDDPFYCSDCAIQFVSEAAYKTHLGSSNKHATTNLSIKPTKRPRSGSTKRRGRPRNASQIVNNGMPTSTHCEVCGKFLSNDVQARKHYEAEHPGTEYLKRYMCDVCGHTTRQYANLMVHMRTHTNEKPYECPHCARRFSMPSNRDRHLVVHTGEKRYQCQHCNRRFTQSSAVKLHIQTVHLKIPYAPWDKKNRKRRKELESAGISAMSSGSCLPPPAAKLTIDPHSDYLNVHISYNE